VDLPEALRRAADESPDILIENYIPGRELTVAVLDGESLPVVEIKPKDGLYDYEAKYTTGKTEYIAPAEIDANLAAALQAAAAKLFGIIGASGLARVDFLLDSKGDYYCLELNTLPGMTDLSLAPMAAKCVGIDFDQLVDRIIKSALTG
jgi:D-alanine-D-alanine ligase